MSDESLEEFRVSWQASLQFLWIHKEWNEICYIVDGLVT